MARASHAPDPARQLLVGIASESVTAFGRAILQGAVRYANLQRKWVLHKDFWRGLGWAAPWPECDGAIAGGLTQELFDAVRAGSRHLVTCSGNVDPVLVPVVCLDDDAAGAMAADHLEGLGLKRFAIYGPADATDYPRVGRPSSTFKRRARGYREALAARGFACAATDIEGDAFYESLLTHRHHPRLIAWLDALPKPIGIFAVDDVYAHDLAEACREAGIGVPEHVAIIGVNDDELLCESAWPPLTSIDCSFERMGYHAARLLERLMAGEELGDDERLTLFPPIRVHQRMSTNVIAVDQPAVAEALRYIREHACDPCAVEDVIAATSVSRRALERQFALSLGRTPHDEIARVRLETARRLLLEPDLTIDEIGTRCGFSAVQSFNRFFRQSLGLTPAAFRRQSRPSARGAARA